MAEKTVIVRDDGSGPRRLAGYTAARQAGEEPYNACVTAGVDPTRDAARYERWYQASLAPDGGGDVQAPAPRMFSRDARSGRWPGLRGTW